MQRETQVKIIKTLKRSGSGTKTRPGRKPSKYSRNNRNNPNNAGFSHFSSFYLLVSSVLE